MTQQTAPPWPIVQLLRNQSRPAELVMVYSKGKEQAMQTESDEIRKYLDDRKRESVKIDPQTAEVTWQYAEAFDPYGVHVLPPEYRQVGREYFARRPDSEIWAWFGDLPYVVSRRLLELYEHELAFPAGLQELLARDGPKE